MRGAFLDVSRACGGITAAARIDETCINADERDECTHECGDKSCGATEHESPCRGHEHESREAAEKCQHSRPKLRSEHSNDGRTEYGTDGDDGDDEHAA